MKTFSAPIKIIGVNPYVVVPKAVSAAFGVRGTVRVLMKAAGLTHGHYKKLQTMTEHALKGGGYLAPGGWFRANLVPTGKGGHILYLNAWIRNRAKADVGDRVKVTLKADAKPYVQPMPPLFRAALGKHKDAKKFWDTQSPSFKKEVLRYLNFLKSREALARNVARMIARLKAKKRIY